PGAEGECVGGIDLLFGTVIDLDGESEEAIGPIFGGEKHIGGGAGAEVEDSGPVGGGGKVDPGGEGAGGEGGHDAGGERDVVVDAIEGDGAVNFASGPDGAIDKGAGAVIAGGIGGGG